MFGTKKKTRDKIGMQPAVRTLCMAVYLHARGCGAQRQLQ